MQVYRDIDRLPLFHQAVVTIGTFDGVHLGHQRIIRQLKEEAAAVGGESVIITFHPHPREVILDNPRAIRLLNSIEERIALLESHGIDHLVIVPFTKEFSQLSAREYVSDFLVKRFRPHRLIIGYDHRFGKGREGNYRLLEILGAEFGFGVKEIPEHIINEVTISSTKIRAALSAGDIEEANMYLGYPYFFEGKVIQGDKRGRRIGFPTANLEVQTPEKLIPANGVYAVEVETLGPEGIMESGLLNLDPKENPINPIVPGMMNIGVRPTIGGTERMIEVHLLGFDKEIYDRQLLVSIRFFLRPEQKFDNLDSLKKQLEKDREDALSKLS